MVKLPAFRLLLLFVLCLPSSTQTRPSGFPKPPEPADKSSTTAPPPATPKPRIDGLQLQRDAKEILELSQSLQLDIHQVNHGLLPKETIEKLKRIEKLSKHLRGELTQ